MKFRLNTSKRTAEIFDALYQREYLQPFALAKIAIALSIKDGFVIENQSQASDSNGLELNRQTITGENDSLFKALIEMQEKTHLSDEEYFPDYVKKYIDNGAVLLEQEYKYNSDIYIHLVHLEKGI